MSLMSMTMPWVFWTRTVVEYSSELSPLGNASVISWRSGISELYREFPNRSLRKGSQQEDRRQHSYTERKTEICLDGKTSGSCSRRDTCRFLHPHAKGDREDNVEWSGDTQEIHI